MRFIKQLSDYSKETLRMMQQNHPKSRCRNRAHMILLSHEGYTRNEIAKIFDVKHDTVSTCFKRWENEGLTGLLDKPRAGRPRLLTPDEEVLAIQLIEEDPRNSKKAQSHLQAVTGKTVSEWTFKRILKREDLKWKRMRRSLKAKQDVEAVEESKKKLLNSRREKIAAK